MQIDRTTLLAAAMALLAAACGAPEEGSSEELRKTGPFAETVAPVLDQHCSGCHAFTRASLLEDTGHCVVDGDVVEKPLVKPGQPEESILWMKIANVSESFAYGNVMPPTGQGGLIETDPEAFAAIEAWIEAGALE